MLKRVLVTTAVLSFGAGGTAVADPKFEYGKKEDAKVDPKLGKDTEYNASVEAGAVFTTGNSETTTATAGAKVSRKRGDNKLGVEGSVAYAKSSTRVATDDNMDGVIGPTDTIATKEQVTAEQFAGKVRYDRFLTDFNSLFIAGLVSRDLPAGKREVLGGQAGYSRRLYKSEKAEAVAEIGYDYSHEGLVGGNNVSIHSARGFLGYKAEMSEGVTWDSSIEALTNLNHESLTTTDHRDATFGEDTRVNIKLAIAAKVGKNLAFQTSLEAHFDNRPAPLKLDGKLADDFVPSATKIDTIMKASLIYTIF
ncbi:MAG TPA: DUF481 domain-containing protein [Kofleriaceae bacterium]|jgi:hypothetical protein